MDWNPQDGWFRFVEKANLATLVNDFVNAVLLTIFGQSGQNGVFPDPNLKNGQECISSYAAV